MRRTLGTLTLLVALAAVPAAAADPAADLKNADVSVRLAAVETLRRSLSGDADTLLIAALGDADWEVAERAATALGERGADGAAKALAEMATSAAARRVRLTAARAFARLPG